LRSAEKGFQTVQGSVAPSSERRVTGLTAKGLDPLGTAMLAIPDQRMNVCVCDSKIGTFSVRTGEALGVHPLRGSPAAFHFIPGTRHLQALAPQSARAWRRVDKLGNRVGNEA
jgi:hypothetical protein